MPESISPAFTRRIAIVTGAARGVGFAISKALALKGYLVVISDIDSIEGTHATKSLNETMGAGTAVFIHCDLARLSSIDKLLESTVQQLGSYSLLVNNAGYLRAPFLALSAEHMEQSISVNLTAPLYALQRAVMYWNAHPHIEAPAVVTVTSSSSFKTYASILPYGAAKAGAAQFTFASRDFGPRIRVTAVAPTAIATGFELGNMRIATEQEGPGYTPEDAMRAMGLERLSPEDVANEVVRCAEDKDIWGIVVHLDKAKGAKIFGGYEDFMGV
ncbi:putative short chain dehydrogenase [Pseudovirgaria hyperparasitica]|uniref:Putative short chain dehydrogenase n=1 Tax=Pseudovirgaria hyperparasitica TaxID=470096 RepID=A0A6A6VX87_9PEZI|nr:putative short chain dehydrogenase [Pseudovirgaria hyperparasitica]KAF2753861.1 putative short chain dehydrogenase [Pseudovirgaria hyperparasitica]